MSNNSEMTFLEHLSELRTRIFKIFSSIILFAILGYIYSDIIIQYLIKPVSDPSIDLQVLKITSIFTTKLRISFFSGLIFSLPIILYQTLFFIKPALNNQITIKRIYIYILFSLALSIFGLFFAYKILIPISIDFFKSISFNLIDSININLTLDGYLSYFIWILIITSSIYQLPIFILLCVKTNLIDIVWLKRNRRYVVVFFFIIAALLSPPDPLSQIFIALPLILLYELSIIISKIFYNEEK